ncbi:MAG: polysaccharide deacetylase family protein, partial [Chloroflexota bacterium]|nr:polysaccharide deacetylase family protein [Chloroflexota bacterium]
MKVALTFDDGPNPPRTDQVMEILDSRGARGTFFV